MFAKGAPDIQQNFFSIGTESTVSNNTSKKSFIECILQYEQSTYS